MIQSQNVPALLVDAGNTRIKLRYFASRETWIDLSLDADSPDLGEIPPHWNPEVMVVSASGAFPEILVSRWPGSRLKIFSPETISGIDWAYENPSNIGKDRASNILAGRRRFTAENLLIVSAGTCITFDFLSASGQHLGGFISPGLQMRFQAMHQFTHALPMGHISHLKSTGQGTDTQSCLAGGVVWGMVAEIEHHTQRSPFGSAPFHILLTGGDAVFLARFLKPTTFVAPDLIFEGLLAVLDELG